MGYLSYCKNVSFKILSFNSLYGIQSQIFLYLHIFLKYFQFPLWDTTLDWYIFFGNKLSFNSLYGIPIIQFCFIQSIICLSIPFMGYKEIIKNECKNLNVFQFPLWDTLNSQETMISY